MSDFFSHPRVQELILQEPMLRGLDRRIFEHIRDAIKEVEPSFPPYNPYLYEPLLTDVGKLLDRCLAYRREGYELEAQAVRTALEYDLFEKVAGTEADLIKTVTSTTAVDAQKAAQEAAADAFDGGDSLSKGFKVLTGKGAASLKATADSEASRREGLEKKLEYIRKHQKLLKDRHTTIGHALNYEERRARVIDLLIPDVKEAYQKARAAKAGLEAQLGIFSKQSWSFPTITDDNEKDVSFLDRLVVWTRGAMKAYEVDCLDDVAFDRVIPLVSAWAHAIAPLIDQQVFNASMSTGKGKVGATIKVAIPAGFEKARVRGVGLSIATAHADELRDGLILFGSWAALIFPPPQSDPFHRVAHVIQRSPIVLGRVGVYQLNNPPEMQSGEEVWNLDPREGEWKVVVEPATNFGRRDPLAWPRELAWLKDIKLHLRIVARPKKAAADWDFGA
jgi:hypothetical protein